MPYAHPPGPFEAAYNRDVVPRIAAIHARLEEMKREVKRHEDAAVARIEAGADAGTVLADLRYAVATLTTEKAELVQEAALLNVNALVQAATAVIAVGAPTSAAARPARPHSQG